MNKESCVIKWFRIPILIWGIATLFYAFEIMLKSSMGSISGIFSSEFLLSNTELATLSSAFYFTYIILQIPAGILIDRFGVRKMLPIAAAAALLGTFFFSLGNNFETFLIARIMMGVCGSLGFLCAITLAVQWFSIKNFALFAGLTNFIGYLGGAMSGMPLTVALNHTSWQVIYSYFAIICVIILIASIVFVYDNKENKSKQNKTNIKEVFAGIFRVDVVANGLFCAFTMGATFALCDLWGREFLLSLGYSNYYSSLAGNSLIFIGIAITAPMWGWLTRFLNAKYLLMIGAVLGFLASGVYLYFALPVIILCLLSLCIGASQSSHILSFSYVHANANKKVISAVFAFVNLCGVAGGAIVQLVIGILLDKHVPKDIVMGIIPFLFLLAFLITLIMKRSK